LNNVISAVGVLGYLESNRSRPIVTEKQSLGGRDTDTMRVEVNGTLTVHVIGLQRKNRIGRPTGMAWRAAFDVERL